jgi:DNA-binding CsgD family transcriptional regulator
MHGIDVISRLRAQYPEARTIFDDEGDRSSKKLIARGCSNKIVADRLEISEDTVKGHVSNILEKLKANDRTHAVTIALHCGYFKI